MSKRGQIKKLAILGVAAALTFGLAAPAAASSPTSSSNAEPTDKSQEVVLAARIDGEYIPVDELPGFAPLTVDEPPAVGDGPTPYLIDLVQWTRCYIFNEMDDVFASYIEYWDGDSRDIRLKCGTDGWGYKHIQIGHQDDWQGVYDHAVSIGWNPASQGMNSWDDLMSVATSAVIFWPDGYTGHNPINQTRCAISSVFFVNANTGVPVYTFWAQAAWATNSDRLITSFPTSSQVC